MQANKYYVVWAGHAPGVYDSWEEAELQIKGYPNASFRAFRDEAEAVQAFREGFDKTGLLQEVARQVERLQQSGRTVAPAAGPAAVPYRLDAIAVDAACSGNPGRMEYRGVYLKTGEQLFHVGPLEGGTNNVGEFLAIVHALALQQQQGTRLPIYSDSYNARLWVSKGACKTQLKATDRNQPVFDLIGRAERWLQTHRVEVPVVKWETKIWGEIPADFGRK